MNNDNIIPVNENIEEDLLSNSTEDEMPDEKVSCEDASNSDHIQSTEDAKKQIVQQRGGDLEFFDNVNDYIYNEFGPVNSVENRNSRSFHIGEKKDNPWVTVDGPELLLNKKLHVNSFQEWPNIIPEVCKILMNEERNQESIDPSKPYEVDSTIEIHPVNENPKEWKMFLRRDVIRCYRKYGEKNQKNRKIYINYAKRAIKEYKQDNSEQSPGPKEKRYIPKIHECPKCGFYVCEPYCIKKTNGYYAVIRSTGERIITISPHDHYNNEQWVQKKETWEAVCQLIDDIKIALQLKELPIQYIYTSFGRWPSQAENGRLLPNECHAHINIVLTKKAIKACEGRTDELSILKDSIFAPVAYGYLDAIELLNYIAPVAYGYLDAIKLRNYIGPKSESRDDDEEDANLLNTDDYYSESSSRNSGRHLRFPMHAKPLIIRRLVDKKCEKANKIFCHICI